MRHWTFPLCLLLCAAAPAAADVTVRNIGSRYASTGIATVAVDIPVGEVTIETWDSPQIAIEMQLRCRSNNRRCADSAKVVKLLAGNRDERLRFRVENWPKVQTRGLHAVVRLRLPARLAVDAELGVGELRITGVAGNLDADLGVGEVQVTLPQDAVASVRLDAGIGEATLRTREKRYEHAGVGVRTLRWNEGTGTARVTVDCGVGEVQVRLE
jgi:hypothetical protein